MTRWRPARVAHRLGRGRGRPAAHPAAGLSEGVRAASSPAIDAPPARYDDLRALVINCTLKRSPETSDTQELIGRSTAILDAQGVQVDVVRAADRDIATGVWPARSGSAATAS